MRTECEKKGLVSRALAKVAAERKQPPPPENPSQPKVEPISAPQKEVVPRNAEAREAVRRKRRATASGGPRPNGMRPAQVAKLWEVSREKNFPSQPEAAVNSARRTLGAPRGLTGPKAPEGQGPGVVPVT